MVQSVLQFLRAYHPVEVAIELAVIWVIVFLLFRFLERTRGAGVLRGFAVVAIVLTVGIRLVANAFGTFERLTFIYNQLVSLLALLLIVVFQPELRQGMVRLSEVFSRGRGRTMAVVDEVDNAVQFLSRNQFGALIVFERTVALGSTVEGGVRLDANLSGRLLESIFYPNNPLHDLAVVVRGDRILAANVQLPLADVGMVPAELGSRHRAAVGVTTETDSLVVVVSEETGSIRLAERGQLSPPIPREEFRARFASALAARSEDSVVGDAALESGAAESRKTASASASAQPSSQSSGGGAAAGAAPAAASARAAMPAGGSQKIERSAQPAGAASGGAGSA